MIAALQILLTIYQETMLTGRYLGSKEVIKELKERDRVQVYDLNVKINLETVRIMLQRYIIEYFADRVCIYRNQNS